MLDASDAAWGNVETQSQSIMSAMLGFDEMEGNECDEATEDDLKLAHVVCEEDDILPPSFCKRSLICLLSRCVALG